MTCPSPPPTSKGRTCKTCGKPESPHITLKECGRCGRTGYCSRDCQKADWKEHKKVCLPTCQSQPSASATTGSKPPPSAVRSTPAVTATVAERVLAAPVKPSTASCDISHLVSNLDVELKTPFTRLAAKWWLHRRTEKDVFTLLIDTIHLRVMEDQQLAVQTLKDVITVTRIHADRMLIVRFLEKADSKNLLPNWWSSSKQDECVWFSFGLEHFRAFPRRSDPSAKKHQKAKERDEVASSLLLQMRIFAEQVYGCIPGKQSVMPELERCMLRERDELIRNVLSSYYRSLSETHGP
jgi:splicing suppressor protein 51